MYYIVSVDEGKINIVDASGEVTGVAGNPIRIDPTGTTAQPISATSLPLPTGASISALQTSGNVSLASIDTKLSSALAVTESGIWNINNISGILSLPTGASTSELQTSGNVSLASIDLKFPSLGQKTMSGSVPVVIASDQGIVSINPLCAISAGNSSTSNLASGAVFPGLSTEVLAYRSVQISLKTDQNCSVQFQQSQDQTNWDLIDTYTVSSGVANDRTFPAGPRYAKVVVTNTGSATTTYFRLQTILIPSYTPMGQMLKEDSVPVVIASDQQVPVAIVPAPLNKPIQILWDKAHSAVNAGEWQDLNSYTVPTGYNLSLISLSALSEVANERARVIQRSIMGTYNCATNTFTDGASVTLPRYETRLYALVTTAIGAASNDTFTVTYTNELGATGRTGTVTIPKSSLAGTRLEVTLQSGDNGIIDITNITHTATGQAGAVAFNANFEIFYLVMASSGTQYATDSVGVGGTMILEGDTIWLQYLSTTKTTYIRRLSVLGALMTK